MKALIDGDIVCYRCACSAQEDEPWVAMTRADKTIEDILGETHAISYSVFLTGTSNFRRTLDPSYKANRPVERPVHWESVRDYLVRQHRAILVEGCEADDYLGIYQDKLGDSTVICSIDKDMLQISGLHYNFVKKTFTQVSDEEGRKHLYIQSLVGDRSDNIFGVHGIGPVKANKALDGLTTEEELYEACLSLYEGDTERFHRNMQLLYIWRKPDDIWVPPQHRKLNHEEGSAT